MLIVYNFHYLVLMLMCNCFLSHEIDPVECTINSNNLRKFINLPKNSSHLNSSSDSVFGTNSVDAWHISVCLPVGPFSIRLRTIEVFQKILISSFFRTSCRTLLRNPQHCPSGLLKHFAVFRGKSKF